MELSREKKWNNIKLSILISKSLYWVGFDRAAVVSFGLWKLKRNDELGEENKKTFRVTQQQLEILSTPPDTQSDRGAGHSGRGEVRKTTRPSLVFKGGTPIRITKEINVISIESLSCCRLRLVIVGHGEGEGGRPRRCPRSYGSLMIWSQTGSFALIDTERVVMRLEIMKK